MIGLGALGEAAQQTYKEGKELYDLASDQITEKLDEADDLLLTFQSRFGRERWLEPYTQPTLEALAREGVRRVDVVCPGFAVDCLETLEEISVENDAAFRAAGGEALRYIPCLNAAGAHADALAALARAGEGWS